mmetsp:Transcript_16899/g.43089  ORF Transcript_16899/g.43089 Transcript_16899/m.43089 type:complete len:357 (+) Transcript_16899:783-1853(+)
MLGLEIQPLHRSCERCFIQVVLVRKKHSLGTGTACQANRPEVRPPGHIHLVPGEHSHLLLQQQVPGVLLGLVVGLAVVGAAMLHVVPAVLPLLPLVLRHSPSLAVVHRGESPVDTRHLKCTPESSSKPAQRHGYTEELSHELRGASPPVQAILHHLSVRPRPFGLLHKTRGSELHVGLPLGFSARAKTRHFRHGDCGVGLIIGTVVVVVDLHEAVGEIDEPGDGAVVFGLCLLGFGAGGDSGGGTLFFLSLQLLLLELAHGISSDFRYQLLCLHPTEGIHVQHRSETERQRLPAQRFLRPRHVQQVEHPHAVNRESQKKEDMPHVVVLNPQKGSDDTAKRATSNQDAPNEMLQEAP